MATAALAAEPDARISCRSPRDRFSPPRTRSRRTSIPDWFRDAKLGIWAHWGPQAVPMFGDWYARQLYMQGHPQYKDHLEHYGHPTKVGYKDIIPLWKAEKWDPDRLMGLYKKAGARYFVSMGVHHDNFDLWNSTHHKWNAVKMGPHRDVVGDWQKAAKKLGLRFGVSEHLGASFTWFQDSHRSDKTGPLAGVPYDGADPKYAGPLPLAGRARRHGLVQQGPALAPRVVRPDQGPGRSVPSRPALHRRRRALRQRGRPEHDRPSLQRQRRSQRRQDRRRLHLQAELGGQVGGRPGARGHAGHPALSLADRHLDRRLVLQPHLEVPRRRLGHSHARRHRQQEWQPADQRGAAPRWQPRPRGRADARRAWPTGSRSTARGSTRPAPG